MALTRKAILYILIAYVFIGLALGFGHPYFTIFVIPLALMIFYSTAAARINLPHLLLTREITPPRSFGGEPINVNVRVENLSAQKIDQIHIEDFVDSALSIERGDNRSTTSLNPNGLIELSYTISSPTRGRYLIGPLHVNVRDLFGFNELTAAVETLDQVLVLPKIENLGSLELRSKRIGPWPGNIPSKSTGPGTEFFELRPYVSGDELRRINWKASAKRGGLVSNEYESERVTDVLVVVDCSEGALSRFFPFNAEEFEIELAASLCSQLLLQGNRVGLLAYGAERTWVPPAFGKRHLLRILSGLAILKAGKPLIPVGYAVESIVNAVLPARAVVVLISPIMGYEIVEVVREVAQAGYSVFCFTPQNTFPPREEKTVRMLARTIIALERAVNMKVAAKSCRLIQLSPQSAVRVVLRRSLAWRPA